VRNGVHDGEAIALGGPEYATFREIVETICRALSVRRAFVPLPLAVAGVQARLMSAVLSKPPLVPATLELFAFENSTDLDAVERNFGFKPRGFRQHLATHGIEV
jgi:uncharacterized protein YbjT (DUF2867 family)